MKLRRTVSILGAALLLLTACGGAKQESSLTLVQGAGAAVIAEKTARVEMRLESDDVTFTMDGQIDFANLLTSLTIDVPMVGAVEFVSDGTSAYMRKAGAGWTRIELTGVAAEQATQGLGADPRALLEQLSDASGITVKGTEELRGVEVTRYSGEVDIRKALVAQGMPQEQIDLFDEQIKGAGTVTSTVDVYLDEDGLAHRTMSRTKVGSLMDITMTMDLLDFGEPVDITVPAASDVVRTETASTQYEVNQLTQSILAGS
ncbi:MAG: hypothetical protein ACT452_06260 [Microthrixaceae bacterium]